mgnify:CR=1 FL=1
MNKDNIASCLLDAYRLGEKGFLIDFAGYVEDIGHVAATNHSNKLILEDFHIEVITESREESFILSVPNGRQDSHVMGALTVFFSQFVESK